MAFRMRWPWRRAATARTVGESGARDSNFTWLANEHDAAPRWAHASGWMLLSRERRSLSCVVPACRNATLLLDVMPELCDRLTEGGYPWEVLVVDASGDGHVAAAAAPLARTVPLRIAASNRRTSRADALLNGITHARGDGVLLADPTMNRWLGAVPAIIERWVEGDLAVSCYSVTDPAGFEGADVPATPAVIDTRDFDETHGSLVLLDRSILDGLGSA